MEAVQILECSPEGLPGVWGAERSDGGGGNWGGPPRPGGSADVPPTGVACPTRGNGVGWVRRSYRRLLPTSVCPTNANPTALSRSCRARPARGARLRGVHGFVLNPQLAASAGAVR